MPYPKPKALRLDQDPYIGLSKEVIDELSSPYWFNTLVHKFDR
jgi:hypothetical protein